MALLRSLLLPSSDEPSPGCHCCHPPARRRARPWPLPPASPASANATAACATGGEERGEEKGEGRRLIFSLTSEPYMSGG
uniref:Uncharacterized protein n=1 Tax=Setaria italica TaxID=4555 RepID=K3ZKQ0_SETIT